MKMKILILLLTTCALIATTPVEKPTEEKKVVDAKPYDETIFEMFRVFSQITQLVGGKTLSCG